MNAGAFLDLRAAFAAKDRRGYQELHQAGAFFLVPANTPALYLEVPRDTPNVPGGDNTSVTSPIENARASGGGYVRVLGEGKHAGRAGWVFGRVFHAAEAGETGDEPPFPPPV